MDECVDVGEEGVKARPGDRDHGQADDNMRVRASVSGKGGRRRGGGGEKPMEKYARASKCQLFHFSSFLLLSILGFSRPNMNRCASPKANTMEVWCPAAISFDFFCDLKK